MLYQLNLVNTSLSQCNITLPELYIFGGV